MGSVIARFALDAPVLMPSPSPLLSTWRRLPPADPASFPLLPLGALALTAVFLTRCKAGLP